MKRFSLITLMLTGMSLMSFAKDGYRIQIKFKDVKDSTFYLAHYFAKPLPTIYKTDSAKLDHTGSATVSSTQKITGGMYMIMLADRKTYFEMLLNNGDDISITINSTKDLPNGGLSFKNSPENTEFLKYEDFVKSMGEKHQQLQGDLAKAKNSVDSAAIKDKMTESMKSLITFRNDLVKNNPNMLLAKIFKALDLPKVPEGQHLLPNGKVDSNFAYNYYKAHYWENFDLKDGRLINAPMYDARLEEYFQRLVVPSPDSVIKEADWILAQTHGTGDLFNYTLSWLANFGQESKVMGMDKVYVHIVENYYMKGDATWLTNDLLEKHIKRAGEISPNLLGNKGYDMTLKDTSGKEVTVSNIKAKYKLLVFWEPTCGHCMKEVPELDSVYRAENLKAKGLKIIGVCTEINEKVWKEFINKNKLGDWVHLYDPEHKSNHKAKYDVYSTPTIYLLDEKGIIRGKRLDHTNIATLIDILDKQDAAKQKTSSK